MADMMAVISKAVFEKMTKAAKVGDVLETDRYTTGNPALGKLSEEGSRLFLFTVRPPDEKLWLVGVLSGLSFDGESWVGQPNTTKITDVGGIKDHIKFESGVGIHAKPGTLGMSLQTPRGLTAEDVELLLGAASGSAPPPAAAAANDEMADDEGGEDDELDGDGEGGDGDGEVEFDDDAVGENSEADADDDGAEEAPAAKAKPAAKSATKKKPAAKKPAPKKKPAAKKPAAKKKPAKKKK